MSFTKGEWKTKGSIVLSLEPKDDGRLPHVATAIHEIGMDREEQWANAHLIAAAGTAATRAEEMGYDGRAAVEALPELLGLLQQYVTACRDQDIKLGSITGDAKSVLNKAKGGRG